MSTIRARAVVVGGGVMGVAIAHHLAQRCDAIDEPVVLLEKTRLADARALRELVPGLVVDDGSIGAYEPDGGGVDPVRTVETFAALAREAGAITRIGTRMTAIVCEGRRVIGVDTNDGRILATDVVVATGPWSRPLLAAIGIDSPLSVLRPEQHFTALPRPHQGFASDATERVEDAGLHRFG